MSPYDVLKAVRAQRDAEEAEKSRPKPETEGLPRYDWDYDIDALVRIFDNGRRVPWDMQANRPLSQEEIEAGRKRVEEKRKRAPKLPRPFLTWWEEGKLDEFLERHPEWKQTLKEKYGYGDG